MEFKVSSRTTEGGGVMIVSVEGELDFVSAGRLLRPTEVAIKGPCPLILDLSHCPFIDSTGLRLMLHVNHGLSNAGTWLVIVTDRPQVKRILSVTSTDKRVPVFAALDEAIAWLLPGAAKAANAAEPPTTGPD
jgi:anti-sigma B factor antagonist